MENFFNIMQDKNSDEEYSSLCSSCNSALQSMYSIGLSSSFELNNENQIIPQIKENENIKNIDTINGDVNEYTLDNHIKETAFVRDTIKCVTKPLIPIESCTYEKQEIYENNNDEIGCSTTKKIKYVEPLDKVNINLPKIISIEHLNFKYSLNNIIPERITRINQDSEKKENHTVLSADKRKTSKLKKNYEILDTKVLKTAKEHICINKNLSSSSTNLLMIKHGNKTDYVTENILSHRKKILTTVKSILDLCDSINIMREIILQEISKK